MSNRVYTDIDPRCEWMLGEDSDVLLVDVSGFKKEDLRVQIDTSKKLKITGECIIEGNTWCRFHKEFNIQKDFDVKKIQAKFDEGILYVIVPKTNSEQQPVHQTKESTEYGNTKRNEIASFFENRKIILRVSLAVAVMAAVAVAAYLINRYGTHR